MNALYFGGPVDGGTFPADIWGDYMGRIKGSFCGDFPEPQTPFSASPFYGKYSKSGGSLTGGDDGTVDPTVADGPGRARHGGGGRPSRTAAASPTATTSGFDPTQYESAPQGPPETEPPPDAGADGGVPAPG